MAYSYYDAVFNSFPVIADAMEKKDPDLLAIRLYAVYKEMGQDIDDVKPLFDDDGLFNKQEWWDEWGWDIELEAKAIEKFCGFVGIEFHIEEV